MRTNQGCRDNKSPRKSESLKIIQLRFKNMEKNKTDRIIVIIVQDMLANANSIGTGSIVELDTDPLVNGKRFVAVHEPRQVAHPVQISGNSAVLNIESTNVHQWSHKRSD